MKIFKRRLIKTFPRTVYRAGRFHGRLENKFGKH